MLNRKKLKEVLEIEAEKAGGVRALARRYKINATSLQDYIDEETMPGSKMVSRIAAGCRKPPAYFFDESASNADSPPTISTYTPVRESQAVYFVATEDKRQVIAEVGEILDSGDADIIDALVKNVREFRRAVDTHKKLNSCHERIENQQEQIDDLTKKVDRLTAPPIGADHGAG